MRQARVKTRSAVQQSSRQCSGTKIQKIHQDKRLEKRLERRYTKYDEELAKNEGNTDLNTKGREDKRGTGKTNNGNQKRWEKTMI